jgi:hypothetical protein
MEVSNTSQTHSRASFDELEHLLRDYETSLCRDAVQRFMVTFPHVMMQQPEAAYANMVQSGSQYVHRLILVGAALYPSETTLRHEYQWTVDSPLIRFGIGLEHQRTLLSALCSSARETLDLAPEVRKALNTLEVAMLRILDEVFSPH